MNLKLIPLESQAVFNQVHHLKEGIERVLEFTNDISFDDVINAVFAGRLLLWIGFVDDKYAGFCTTRLERYRKGNVCWLENVYCKPNVDSSWIYAGDNCIETYARKEGCFKIKFSTIRDRAFERRLKDTGYKPESVIFSREVKRDGE